MAQGNNSITDGQRLALIKLCELVTKHRGERLWLVSQLLGKKIASSAELSIGDWRKIRDQAYPNWPNNDWIVSDEFRKDINTLHLKYEEEVMGQKTLF